MRRSIVREHWLRSAVGKRKWSAGGDERIKGDNVTRSSRDGAFRRTILEVYDYRCAACDVRVLLDQSVSLVEAAHLIPFNVSRNDKPTNGMALCPNHHWAMDRHLIAPVPDTKKRAGIWQVNKKRPDDRIEGQRDLVAIAGKSVIPPSERSFTQRWKVCGGARNTWSPPTDAANFISTSFRGTMARD